MSSHTCVSSAARRVISRPGGAGADQKHPYRPVVAEAVIELSAGARAVGAATARRQEERSRDQAALPPRTRRRVIRVRSRGRAGDRRERLLRANSPRPPPSVAVSRAVYLTLETHAGCSIAWNSIARAGVCGSAPSTRMRHRAPHSATKGARVSFGRREQSLARSGSDVAGDQAGVSPSGPLAASDDNVCVRADEAGPRHADGDRHTRAKVALERPDATGSERAVSQRAARAFATHVDLRAPRCLHAPDNDARPVIHDVARDTHHRKRSHEAQAAGRGVLGRGGGRERWRRWRARRR
jgi:hypothetical protein